MKRNRKFSGLKKVNYPLLILLGAFTLSSLLSALPVLAAPAPFASTENTADNTADNMTEADYEAEDAIHISCSQDFIRFAQNCASDIWSQGKIFVLDKDIDLSGTAFSPVPTFGGIFLGQGHTISGFSLEGGSNDTGLFRYVQETGEIYALSLSGNASAEKSHSNLALLAGCNRGLLSGCSVSGNVNGGSRVGGVVGINEITGIISDCRSDGSVNGRHLSGGIAGSNEGTIVNCVNHSFVNTTPDDNKIDLSALDILAMDETITDLLTKENAASVTDIGGIAGNNSGILRACTNDGSVGYPHVGYNIGGIAGSQTGFLEGCVNYGTLNGRKDIGGIAGQMEPSGELEFSEDTLARLAVEFDKLHELLTRLDADAKGSSHVITGQVDQLLNSVDNARYAIDEIMINAGSHVEELSGLTDLASLPSPEPVSLEFLDDLEKPSLPSLAPWPSGLPFPTGIPTAIPTVIPSGAPSAAPSGNPTAVPSEAPTTAPSGAPTAIPTAIPSDVPKAAPSKAPEDASADTSKAVPSDISKAAPTEASGERMEAETISFTTSVLQAAPVVSASVQQLEDAPSVPVSEADAALPGSNPFTAGWPDSLPMPSVSDVAKELRSRISREKIEDDINEVQENIYEDASHVLESLKEAAQNRASILSARIFSAQNSLSGSFSAIVSDTRILNSLLNEENQILLDDIQAVIDEIHVISTVITNPQTIDPDEILTDISDEDSLSDTTGKVMNCRNNGKIHGDLNVGGIAGTLSRENNLDPENDLNWDQGNATLNFRYKERVVVRKCENAGFVEGKKDRIGGIAGEMLLGSVIDCVSSGGVKSSGCQIGGIAGYSNSAIRSCSAKCSLSGKSQIGGIAGYGKNLSGCYSMISIREGESYLGSIAGRADSEASVSDNYFVEGCPAGIDGVSYQGKAQPLSYEEFEKREDLPDIFRQLYLTFTADDQIVSVVTVDYGENFQESLLPAVPKKEGYAGRWEEFSRARLTCDLEIKAIYREYLSTLESSQTVGERPVALVEGTFTPGDSFTLLPVDAYPKDAKTKAECWKILLPESSAGPYVIRYLIPTDMERPVIERYRDNAWYPVDTAVDGSYYVFASDNADIIFSCVDRPGSPEQKTIIITALLLAVIAIAILIRKHRPRPQR